MSRVIVIYWDQLTFEISSLKAAKAQDVVVFVECHEQCTYVKHHKKKLVFLLSAMRHFAKSLKRKRKTLNVQYFSLDDANGLNTLSKCLQHLHQQSPIRKLIATHPGEHHQLVTLKKIGKKLKASLELLEDDRFICSQIEFSTWISSKRNNSQIIMESFYREMRKKTNFLMDGHKPIGGKWNFDKENRNPIPDGVPVPHIDGFKPKPEVKAVIPLVKKFFPKHFGDIEPFWFGITREDAQKALALFIEKALPHFGEYQDAMLDGEAFLFHSVLSQYLNVGLLDPMEVCQQVELEYHQGHISLPCAEGFIRQIIGWREFIRGIYWHYMPDYQDFNAMNYAGKLPDLYWGEKTKMRCLSHTVAETRRHAYSHHIQRLMITGNFATLIGVRPELIHEWYLIVYIDAFEWVEMPNTMGMATFADGGIVGTKPYISGGNYINKMSNFCDKCHYKIKKKNGTDACPFNYLYWNYLITHHDKLKFNHRLRMPLATLARMSREKIAEIKRDSQRFLQKIENGNVI